MKSVIRAGVTLLMLLLRPTTGAAVAKINLLCAVHVVTVLQCCNISLPR